MKTKLLMMCAAAAALVLGACTTGAFPPGSPNPLDVPGAQPTVAERHASNVAQIRAYPREFADY